MANVIITPPASVRNPFALWLGSWLFKDRPTCTTPNPSKIKPIARIREKIKVDRLLITDNGSPAANAVVAPTITGFFAAQGADQCGFCNPGYIVNIVALLRENPDPTDEEILEYLSGNLCRCTGYQSQLRSIRNFLNSKKEGAPLNLEAGVYGEDRRYR